MLPSGLFGAAAVGVGVVWATSADRSPVRGVAQKTSP